MAAASQEYLEKAQLRQSYRNVWHTDLTNATQSDFPCAYPANLLLPVAVVWPMCLLHASQTCTLQRHVKICVLRRVHAMQREVWREQMPRSMPRHGGVLLLRQLSCFDQVPAAGRVQHPDDPVRQLHHRTHCPYLSSVHQFFIHHRCCFRNLQLITLISELVFVAACRVSCSSSSSWPASAPLSPASSATSNCPRHPGRSPAYLTWSTGRSAPVCRHSTRWRWTRGTAR